MRINEIRREPLKWLYHGTNPANLQRIIQHGLSPSHNKPSGHSPDMRFGNMEPKPWIYLCVDVGSAHLYGELVLAVYVKNLDASKLGPDEDDLDRILRQKNRRKEWHEFTWKQSLKLTGQCTYSGVIWPSMLYKVLDSRNGIKMQPLI